MGYMRHHAIIVTSWNSEQLAAAHRAATDAGAKPTPITPPAMNSYASFLIPPDGSKEGWTDSQIGDDARESFKSWMLDFRPYGAGERSALNWVEVEFGSDGASVVSNER